MEKTETSLKDIVQNDYQEKTILDLNIKDNKIGLASDHRGYNLKQKLTKYLTKKGYTVIDYGCDDKTSHDYPEYGFKLGKAVRDGKIEKGIAICGSGIGISIACNKINKVRCAKVNNIKEAKYTRQDNDANIIAINTKTIIKIQIDMETPKTSLLLKSLNPSGRLVIAVLLLTIYTSPLTAVCVPSVTMKGSILVFATITPFIAPITAQISAAVTTEPPSPILTP